MSSDAKARATILKTAFLSHTKNMFRIRMVVLLALLLLCSLLSIRNLANQRKIQRLLEQIRTTHFVTVTGLSPGFVKLSGRVLSANDLPAPFSGNSCAYYKIIVERLESQRRSNTWKPIFDRATDEKSLVLKDGTGSVLVQMADMDVFTASSYVIESSQQNELTADGLARIRNYFDQHLEDKSFEWTKSLRFTEKCLRTGDAFYVFGMATYIPGTAHQIEVRRSADGKGAVANGPERLILEKLEAESQHSKTAVIFLVSLSAILLGITIVLIRKRA